MRLSIKMKANHKLVAMLLALSNMLICIAGSNFINHTNFHTIFTTENTDTTTIVATGSCKHPTEMWGDIDPNVYHVCDTETQTSQLLRCAEGSGFFNGLGYYGCIPYAQWPACISGGGASQQLCDSAHLKQPWEAADPNTFFMCAAEEREPVLAHCELGRGFVHAPTGAGGASITGCAEWAKWRMYMHCEHY